MVQIDALSCDLWSTPGSKHSTAPDAGPHQGLSCAKVSEISPGPTNAGCC